MSAHATKVDRSGATGNLVACTCGYAVGPFLDPDKARDVATEHRRAHQPPNVSSPESRAIANEKARRKRAEARRPEAEGRP